MASQIAITASPISAAVVFFAGILEPLGVSYLTLLAICIPVTLLAVMLTAIVCNFLGCELKDDPVYQERLAKGEVRRAATRYLSCSRTPNVPFCCF
ncbi:MAG: anaerobic C4-dicarboxylate transporter family protein [Escherichia coli]